MHASQKKPLNAMQHHHEEGFCTQKTFSEQAFCLDETVNDMGNSFNECIVGTVHFVEAVDWNQYNDYHKSVIVVHTFKT